ncbi:MAG: heme ABC transporter permease CcmC, partial [Holosporales bacterium]
MDFNAQPKRFLGHLRKLLPMMVILWCLLSLAGGWQALIASPSDYQQGEAVRIMYVHVPASWLGVALYGVMAILGGLGYVLRRPLLDFSAYALAPIGLGLTLISLVTGSIWGKPIWGTWWVWDARLTSMFIQALLYLGYIALVRAHEDQLQGLRMGALLLVIGAVNLPIIKGSVEWWATLHQPASLLRSKGPSLHSSMLTPLLFMTAAYG